MIMLVERSEIRLILLMFAAGGTLKPVPSVGSGGPGADEDLGLEQIGNQVLNPDEFHSSPDCKEALQPAFIDHDAFTILKETIRHYQVTALRHSCQTVTNQTGRG